jgi:hypothetical protein
MNRIQVKEKTEGNRTPSKKGKGMRQIKSKKILTEERRKKVYFG